MSNELVKFWTRHVTLVLDNTESTQQAVNRRVRDVMRDSGLTLPEYRQMDSSGRMSAVGSEIGSAVLDYACDLMESVYADSASRGESAALLIGDLLPSRGDSELEWALADHYLPEESDVAEWLPEESD